MDGEWGSGYWPHRENGAPIVSNHMLKLSWRGRMEICSMATFVFGMNQSLDGYVNHMAFAPGPALFRHFIEQTRNQAGLVYGRGLYEVMRYWDDEHPDWDAAEREYAIAWRSQPKWVVSRTLT